MAEENKFKIFSRTGEVDLSLADGRYRVEGDFTIKDGRIKMIDNSKWVKLGKNDRRKNN